MIPIDKTVVSQAIAGFAFMVSEAVLGKTRFGSWLGLAKALVWFIVGTIFGGMAKLLQKPSQPQRSIQMAGKKDISQLKDVVVLLIKGVNAEQEAAADGKLDLSDSALLFKVIPSIGPAIEGIEDVPSELADLQAEEVAELTALVASELNITDGSVKVKVVAVLEWAGATVKLVAALKGPEAPAA